MAAVAVVKLVLGPTVRTSFMVMAITHFFFTSSSGGGYITSGTITTAAATATTTSSSTGWRRHGCLFFFFFLSMDVVVMAALLGLSEEAKTATEATTEAKRVGAKDRERERAAAGGGGGGGRESVTLRDVAQQGTSPNEASQIDANFFLSLSWRMRMSPPARTTSSSSPAAPAAPWTSTWRSDLIHHGSPSKDPSFHSSHTDKIRPKDGSCWSCMSLLD